MSKMRYFGSKRWIAAGLLLFVGFMSVSHSAENTLIVGDFSSVDDEMLPAGWSLHEFDNIKRHTVYSIAESEGGKVIKAESTASASALFKRVRIDPRLYPIIQWRWMTKSFLEKSDVTRKKGDDYPVRIYITFDIDRESGESGIFDSLGKSMRRMFLGKNVPHSALNYIWANKATVGSIVSNPYTSRAKMLTVEAGDEKTGEWQSYRRNIYDDYHKAFGHYPSIITGVALMTDTDNTAGSAESYYGDIVFSAE